MTYPVGIFEGDQRVFQGIGGKHRIAHNGSPWAELDRRHVPGLGTAQPDHKLPIIVGNRPTAGRGAIGPAVGGADRLDIVPEGRSEQREPRHHRRSGSAYHRPTSHH